MKEEILKVFKAEGREPTLFERYLIDDLCRLEVEMQNLRLHIKEHDSVFEGDGQISMKVNPSETLLDQKRKQFRAIAGELHLTTKSKPVAKDEDKKTEKKLSPLQEALKQRG